MHPRHHRFVPLLAAVVALAGCSNSNSSGPKTDITGTWNYEAPDLPVTGGLCSASLVATVTQTGNSFSGTYTSGQFSCTINGVTTSGGPFSGNVVNGTINGNAVSFDIDDAQWPNTGTLSGNAASGTTTFNINAGGTQLNLSGDWSATKQ